ncbi:MAG: hypothetical protein PHR35_03930, partial [Kiritimatiellae bacterium]|nr:hypothetical protein [Kiritimatiellia bacterium]
RIRRRRSGWNPTLQKSNRNDVSWMLEGAVTPAPPILSQLLTQYSGKTGALDRLTCILYASA